MYKRVNWLDEVKDADTGELIQEGTDQSAGNFNNMDVGISDASIAASMLIIATGQMLANQAAEEIVVELTNTESYPFNNSKTTVSLATTRSSTNYTVDAEVLEHAGEVGGIIITEKLLNGFKVQYDGSATSAKIKLIIKGGM